VHTIGVEARIPVPRMKDVVPEIRLLHELFRTQRIATIGLESRAVRAVDAEDNRPG
jgi:hypothetical protein